MHNLGQRRLVTVSVLVGLALLATFTPALAVPSRTPDRTAQTNGRVNAIVYAGTVVYIGGAFTEVRPAGTTVGSSGVPRNNLAALDATTGQVLPFHPSVNGEVHALAVASGTVYLGGAFTTVGGRSRTRLAAVDGSGAVTGWAPRANDAVLALDAFNNTVYAGGQFTTINASTRRHLAAVTASGALTSWAPRTNGKVEALEATASGVYVAGGFSAVNDTGTAHAARIGVDGTLSSWRPDAPDIVWALDVANGAVYLATGGPGGTALAADAASGTTRWKVRTNGGVQAIAASSTTVYIGGHFTSVGSVARRKLAALSPSGSLRSWNPGANSPLGVWALVATSTRLGVGGDFTVTGGERQQGFAQYSGAI
jgi:trimeric autotransporter adhesin